MWAILFVVMGVAGWALFLAEAERKPDAVPIESESDAEVEQLRCILTSSFARMHIQFGVRGCFGSTDNLLDLEVSTHEALARGWGSAGSPHFRDVSPVRLPLPEGRRHLIELVSALRRKETTNYCRSTSSIVARIYYWCEKEQRGPLMLTTSECSLVPGNRPPSLAYARASGVSTSAEAILSNLPGKQVSGSAEIDRTRRKWGTVYQDGRRVRHEPVEDWIDP